MEAPHAALRLTLLTGALLLACSPALAAPDGSDLDAMRHQPAIAASYGFDSLPPAAGKGITVALISQPVTRELKELLGDRLSLASALTDETSPYGPTEGTNMGNRIASLVAALAPGAAIINVTALDSQGATSYETIRAAVRRATELGARVIVMPLGGSEGNDGLTGAINAALAKGILVLASAGNDPGGAVVYPANLSGVLAIGGTNAQGDIAAFSSVGDEVLYAPGEDVRAVDPDGELKEHSGTTQATAVAGAIFAILWSQAPTLSRRQLLDIVFATAPDIGDASGHEGKLLDGAAALRAVLAARPPAAAPADPPATGTAKDYAASPRRP